MLKNTHFKTPLKYENHYIKNIVGKQEGLPEAYKFFGLPYQETVLNNMAQQPYSDWPSKISHHIWVTDLSSPRDIISYKSDDIILNNQYDKIIPKDRPSNFTQKKDTFLYSIANLVHGANTQSSTSDPAQKGWDHHIFWTNIDLNPLFAQRYSEAAKDGLRSNPNIDYAKTLPSFYALTKYGTLHSALLEKGIPEYKLPITNLASLDLTDNFNPKIHVYQLKGEKWSDIERFTYQFSDNYNTYHNVSTARSVSKVFSDGKSIVIDNQANEFDLGFAHFLQDIDEIREIEFPIQKALASQNRQHYALVSDIFRILAVKSFGGIYFDIDYALFDQNKIEQSGKVSLFKLMQNSKGIFGQEWNGGLCNAFIAASTPNNEVLIQAYELIKRNLGQDLKQIPDYIKFSSHELPILSLTGPAMLSVAYAKAAHKLGSKPNLNLQLQYGKLFSVATETYNHTDKIGTIGYDQWGGTWVDDHSHGITLWENT